MSKWIEFRLMLKVNPEHKTEQWEVITKDGCDTIGIVKWFGCWRCYAFFPSAGTIYERQCLRDLAQFCEQETYKQREASARAKAGAA